MAWPAFGDAFVGPLIAALVVDLVILIPLSLAILETHARSGGPGNLAGALKGVAVNPFILSIAAGMALSVSGIGMPSWLDRFATFLAGAASRWRCSPLGASLANREAADARAASALLTGLKLAVHPAAVFVALWMFGAPTGAAAITVLIAAMPIAGNAFVIAERYGVFVRPVSAAVLISTVVSIGTVSLALAWALQQQG